MSENEKKSGAGFDLASLDTIAASNEGEWMNVMHPKTDEPIGARIKLAGPDSDIVKKAQNKITNRRLKGRGRNKLDAESINEEQVEMLASCTLGWEGIVVNGEEVKFSKDNAVNLYLKYPWIMEQVNIFIGDRANFIKSS